jgi:hypothetical protein
VETTKEPRKSAMMDKTQLEMVTVAAWGRRNSSTTYEVFVSTGKSVLQVGR